MSTVLLKTETTVCEVIMVLSINIKLDKKSQRKLGYYRSTYCSDMCAAIKCAAYWAVVISKFNQSISNQEPLKHTV